MTRFAIVDNTVLVNFIDSGQAPILESTNLLFQNLFIPKEVQREFLSVPAIHLPERSRFSDQITDDKGSYYRPCDTFDPIVLGALTTQNGVDAGEAEAIAQATIRNIPLILTDDKKCRAFIAENYSHIKTCGTLFLIALLDLSGYLPDRNGALCKLHKSDKITPAKLREAYIQARDYLGIPLNGKALSKKSSLKKVLGDCK